jgi:hypothetical protein
MMSRLPIASKGNYIKASPPLNIFLSYTQGCLNCTREGAYPNQWSRPATTRSTRS